MSQSVFISPPSCVIDHDIKTLVDKDINWKNRGYHMIGISGYGPESPQFAAIWNNPNGIEYTFKTNMSPTEFQQVVDNMQNEGYALQCIDGYEINQQINYTAIWEKKKGLDHRIRHGLSSTQFNNVCVEYVEEGYRLMKVSSYNINGKPCYAGIWINDNGPATYSKNGMTQGEFEKHHSKMIQDGYKLIDINGCTCDAEPVFVAIWVEGDGSVTKYDIVLLADEFIKTKKEMVKLGFHPLWISGYSNKDKQYFAVIWEQWHAN